MKTLRRNPTKSHLKTALFLVLICTFFFLGSADLLAAELNSSDATALSKMFKLSNGTQGLTFGKSISLPKLTYLFGFQALVIGGIFYYRIYKTLR